MFLSPLKRELGGEVVEKNHAFYQVAWIGE